MASEDKASPQDMALAGSPMPSRRTFGQYLTVLGNNNFVKRKTIKTNWEYHNDLCGEETD